jgi:PAS domain S-box-containing protein
MKLILFDSIKTKIFVRASLVFLAALTIAAFLSFYAYQRTQIDYAKEKTAQISKNIADQIQSQIEQQITIVREASDLFSPSYINPKNSTDRLKIETALRNFLFRKSHFTESFLIWEPKIELNNDSLSLNETGLDKTGKYVADCKKSGNAEIFSETVENYTNLISTASYMNLRQNKGMNIGTPFISKINTGEQLSIKITNSISEGDRFYGVFGAVCSLDFIIAGIENTDIPYEQAKVFLIADDQTIISAKNQAFLSGISLNDYRGIEAELIQNISNSENNDFAKNSRLIQFSNSEQSWKLYVIIPYKTIVKEQHLIHSLAVVISVILILLALVYMLFYVRKILSPFQELIKSVQKIENGDIVPLTHKPHSDEFSLINNSLTNTVENLNQKVQASMAIAQGDFTKTIEKKSENDLLADAINQISKNFAQLNLINEKQRLEAQEQLWIRKGRFEIANAQRTSEANVKDLSAGIIQSVVKYVDAAFGALYLFEDDGSDFPYIELASAYAFNNSKHLLKEFYPGEGLVGTCALERKKIILRNIPKNYINIATGMGNTSPEFLMILPVFYEEQITAFIEIGFYKEPEKYKTDFIEQLTESIGAWISSTKINEQTKYLLEQSRTHAQELSEKETELGKRIEELKKIQSERAQDEADRDSLLNAVNHTIMSIEYTIGGIFITANDTYLNAMGYRLEDLKGYNVLDLVKDQREELEEVIREVKNGKYIERLMKRYTGKGDLRWLFSTYTPYYNVEGEITKIIYFAFDVTQMVQSEFEYQEKINLLEETIRAAQNKNKDLDNLLGDYRKNEEDLLGKMLEKVREIKELKKIIKNMTENK